MLDGSFVNAIAELARKSQDASDLITDVDGKFFASANLQHLPLKPEPEPSALGFRSLQAFAAFIKENRDKLVLEECVVHVVSAQLVQLLGPLTGERRQRFSYAQATCKDLAAGWLGIFHHQEEFVVGLQSRFDDVGQRADVLKLVSSIKSESGVEAADDGRTQSVATRAGVHLATTATVPNPVRLAPFRTFREVPQPESAFVLRVKQGAVCALFEADGGAWELKAVDAVAQWLRQSVEAIPVLA